VAPHHCSATFRRLPLQPKAQCPLSKPALFMVHKGHLAPAKEHPHLVELEVELYLGGPNPPPLKTWAPPPPPSLWGPPRPDANAAGPESMRE
jgi:hypothetical protein